VPGATAGASRDATDVLDGIQGLPLLQAGLTILVGLALLWCCSTGNIGQSQARFSFTS